MTDAIALARSWAERYRSLGYQPLPSDPRPASEGGRKKPLCKFGEWWEEEAPSDLFERFPTTNIQVMTGRRWNLAVLDLDGPEAVKHVTRNWPRLPVTWVTFHKDYAKSRHYWFSLPRGMKERRFTTLWQGIDPETGEKVKHSAVELLCDRSLVMAPPSVHPKSGKKYGFIGGPSQMLRPAMIPQWLLDMPVIEPPKPVFLPPPVRPAPPNGRRINGVDRRVVLDSIPDKSAIAASWGLRFAQSSSASKGWVSVHDINREDSNPSARFNIESGSFWRPGEKPISLFDLGVELRVFPSWLECRDSLASEFLASIN